jgi:ribosomal protein L2
MGVRKLKAITPGQRFRSVNDFAAITTNAPEKSLTVSKKRRRDYGYHHSFLQSLVADM